MARATPLIAPKGQRFAAPGAGMRTRTAIVLVLGALAAGLGSAWAVLVGQPPLGAVAVGPWTAWPRSGSVDIDPYARAVQVRGPHLPMAAGEGVTFLAYADGGGAALTGRCRYRVAGLTLPSRGWSLALVDRAGRPLDAGGAHVTDADVVTGEDGAVAVHVGTGPAAGAWLRVPASAPFGLALRFYDTPLSAAIEQLPASALPAITRLGCAS